MNKRKLLDRARNNPRDVRFADSVSSAEAHGFVLARVDGSHRVSKHPRVRELLNMQPRKDGKAKPFQVRELMARIDESVLTMETDR